MKVSLDFIYHSGLNCYGSIFNFLQDPFRALRLSEKSLKIIDLYEKRKGNNL